MKRSLLLGVLGLCCASLVAAGCGGDDAAPESAGFGNTTGGSGGSGGSSGGTAGKGGSAGTSGAAGKSGASGAAGKGGAAGAGGSAGGAGKSGAGAGGAAGKGGSAGAQQGGAAGQGGSAGAAGTGGTAGGSAGAAGSGAAGAAGAAGSGAAGGGASGQGGTAGQSGEGGSAGSSAGQGGSAGSAGQGGAAGCADDAACKDDNDCTDDKCVAGLCTNPNNDGATPAQVQGNCNKETCGSGAIVSVPDVTDTPPPNATACSASGCGADGKIVQNNADDGTSCTLAGGAAGVCLSGVCSAGCKTDAECDDQSACTTDTCVANQCKNAPLDEGTPTPGAPDTKGDCLKNVCTAGKAGDVPDLADLPDDSNECTSNACDPTGKPHYTNLDDGTACTANGGNFCINGACAANTCGDGVVFGAEACDGAALAGKNCTTFGYKDAGVVSCKADCTIDASKCVATCGNGLTEPGEECDDATSPKAPGDGCSKFCKNEPIAGDLVITEILFNPESSSNEGQTEWFEIYNTTAKDFDVRGLRLVSATGNGTEMHVIGDSAVTPIVVAAGTWAVFAGSSNLTKNGGINVLYSYGTALGFLNSAADFIRIEVPSATPVVIDSAGYTKQESSSVLYKGASFSLNPLLTSAIFNDVDANWCPAKTPFGTGATKDKGTPGAKNDSCP